MSGHDIHRHHAPWRRYIPHWKHSIQKKLNKVMRHENDHLVCRWPSTKPGFTEWFDFHELVDETPYLDENLKHLYMRVMEEDHSRYDVFCDGDDIWTTVSLLDEEAEDNDKDWRDPCEDQDEEDEEQYMEEEHWEATDDSTKNPEEDDAIVISSRLLLRRNDCGRQHAASAFVKRQCRH